MPIPTCTLTVQILDDGNWNFAYVAADGVTMTLGQWALPLSSLTMLAIQNATTAIPTAAERTQEMERAQEKAAQEAILAASTLPPGWSPTESGINTVLVVSNGHGTPRTSWNRAYRHASGAITEAPCAEDGASTPETRETLLAAIPASPAVSMTPLRRGPDNLES